MLVSLGSSEDVGSDEEVDNSGSADDVELAKSEEVIVSLADSTYVELGSYEEVENSGSIVDELKSADEVEVA